MQINVSIVLEVFIKTFALTYFCIFRNLDKKYAFVYEKDLSLSVSIRR